MTDQVNEKSNIMFLNAPNMLPKALYDTYHITSAEGFSQFWDTLRAESNISAIVLFDPIGMEVVYDILATLPSIPHYMNIPILMVMATENKKFEQDILKMGANSILYIADQMDSYVFYQLIKTELDHQIERHHDLQHLQHNVQSRITAIQTLEEGSFVVRTREEAQQLASLLSIAASEPTLLAIGIAELVINGVEHGLLGIKHEDKNRLIEEGTLVEELDRLLAMDKNKDKYVKVDYVKTPKRIVFKIVDPGEGFDFQHYLKDDVVDEMNKKMAKHGRGISMAKVCFDELTYKNTGNEVWATFLLEE